MIFSEHAKGLFLSSTTVPEAGFLLISYKEGGHEFCSATAVSPSQVLTAAHCFCGTGDSNRAAFSGKTCQPLLVDTTAVFFSPAMGLANVRSIRISDQYSGAYGAQDYVKVTPAAFDLAVADLDKSLPSYVELGSAADTWDVVANASFGRLFVQSNGVDIGLNTADDNNDEFDVGVGQVGVHDGLWLSADECGLLGVSDTFCTHADDHKVSSPRVTTSGFCGGDSGGGLFGWKNDAKKLLGVTAYFESEHGAACPNVGSQSSYYINLQSHLDWLRQHLEPAPSGWAARSLNCEDLIIAKAPTTLTFDGKDIATLAVVDFDKRSLHKKGQPPVSVQAKAEASCATNALEFGTAAFCNLSGPEGRVQVIQTTGNMQVTLCKREGDN